MNERIKEIWNEAGGTFTSGNQHDWPYARIDNPEKFAELIVRECAKRIDYWESRQGEHCDDLLKHFGVTE